MTTLKLVRNLTTLAMLLETAGIALLVFVLVSLSNEQRAMAQPIVPTSVESPVYSKKTVHGKPVSITVPSLGIATDIDDGYYDTSSGRWTITEEAAYFATVSDQANNESGSTFIYGHNSDRIFGKLRGIQDEATATVRTDNGYEFTYKLTSYENVAPTDTQKLVYEGKPRLVLQTCSGFWNETRQLTYFTLVDYKKI